MKKKQLIGLIAGILVLVCIIAFVQPSETLPVAARNTLALMIMVIILLVCETFPLGITCLSTLALAVLLGCAPNMPGALAGFTNATLFFVLASFGISEALTSVPLSKRLLCGLMHVFGKNTKLLLLGIMICVAVLSSVISNVAAAAVFIPIMQNFFSVYDGEERRNATRRCYMIAMPIASMIGGMMTPAGSSINMLAISLLEANAGITVKFVDWMLFGIPIAVVALPLAWLICVSVFPPAALPEEKISHYVDEIRVQERLSRKEAYVLSIVVIMVILWILSSWYPMFNVTVVALMGLLLFFIPGKLQVMTWKSFTGCVSWEAFFLMGSMISLGTLISSTGLSAWIGNVVFPATFVSTPFIVVAMVALITFLLLVVIPVAPALVTMLSLPLISFAQRIGIPPYLVMITLGLVAANCYLFPLDTVPLMTFSTGAYKMFDMPKASALLQVGMIIICSIWIPIAGTLLGII